ncbi:ABC-2 type transport system permease protein [Amycolatopsis arida]|uniref:Transport permease protein n=1 Tax=Amycolatopsis arida TaxID=587909 RepID=A0A1I5SSK9_9PSEU|nr:ABC transporter permease [Amycolatopsis arida]TDX96369.1 ABC-2 type transport system permease protein [Amycolatopsis arida]SFP73621.1 ABC-2 type transport system permease protein [Amycolatopsis arida]
MTTRESHVRDGESHVRDGESHGRDGEFHVRRRPEPYWLLSDALAMTGRTFRHLARSPEQLMLTLFLPVALLLMFRYLFGGAIDTGDVSYVNYVVAGIIAVSVTFNSTITSVAVREDLQEGIVERFRSMPVHAGAVLVGHVAAGLARNLVSVAVMVGVGLAVGFRPVADLGGWLAALGLLALFALAVAWIAAILGLLAKTVEGASGMSMPLVFVPYVSSAFVPPSTMPDVLRVFAENQPVTLVVDTVRALLVGLPADRAGVAVLWWLAILLVVVPLGGVLFRRAAVGQR